MAKVQGGTLEWNGGDLIAFATKENVKAMNQAAILVQATAKKLIGGVGSGKLYRRRKQKGERGTFKASDFHRASSPGRPPARDSGILANSVSFLVRLGIKADTVDIIDMDDLTVVGSVGPDIDKIKAESPRTDPDYGFWLEVGTKDIAKRPWLKPALIKSRRRILRLFKRANRNIK